MFNPKILTLKIKRDRKENPKEWVIVPRRGSFELVRIVPIENLRPC